MLKTLIGVIILLAGLVIFRMVMKRKIESKVKSTKYICDHCGEHHCECRLESDE